MRVRSSIPDDPHAVLDELARRDFMSFLIRAFPHISGGADLAVNWHQDAIAFQLQRVEELLCRRLIVTMPPRNLKSIMISVAWVAWRLGRNPALNFVCASYSSELAGKHARDCRAIMQSKWYRRLFPNTVIARSRSAVLDFETTGGGGRLATSVGGTLTGRGGDIIILDDPIKPDEALSDVARVKVNEWFRTTMATRLNDKASGAFIMVMQRLHQLDLVGDLLESDGGWEELSLPAIASEARRVPLTRGRYHNCKEGDILHAAREPLSELMYQKALLGSANFAAQYQQDPVPAHGNMIRAEWLRTYPETLLTEGGQIVQSWDTASKEGIHSDYSVCITALVYRRRTLLLDVWRGKVEFPVLKKEAIRLARHHGAKVLLVEDAASGTQLIQSLRNEQQSGVPSPIDRRPEIDKLSRLAGVSAMIEAGDLLLPSDASWLAGFKQEVLAFPSGRHDDQVDALSQLLIWVDLQHGLHRPTLNAGPVLFSEDEFGRFTGSGYGWNPDEY